MPWQIADVVYDREDGLIEHSHLIDKKNQLHLVMAECCEIYMGADRYEDCPIYVTFSYANGVHIERAKAEFVTIRHPQIMSSILWSVGASRHDCGSVSRMLRALFLAKHPDVDPETVKTDFVDEDSNGSEHGRSQEIT